MSVSGLAYAFLCLAAVYILVSYVRSYFSEKQFRKFAIANGAESPIQAKTKLPWSLDGMWRVLNSERNGEDLFDDIMVARFRAINGNTSEIKGPFGVKLISTAEPKNIQAMLATKFNDFELGSRRQAQFGVLLGNSIFNVDGPAWSHSRALFRPQFVRDNINDLDATERAAKILIDVIPQGQNGWTTSVDLMPLFFRFTLDTATAFIFGNTVDSQLAAASRAHNVANEHIEFADAFTTGQLWLSTRIKMQTLYWLCDGFQYRAAVEKVRRFTNIIIRRTLEARDNANSKNDGAGKYSVVEELAKSTQDPLEMRDQLIALLGAGRDTTAALLSWTFYLLATDERVFNKLREVIIRDFGSSSGSSKKIDFASLKSCRYLQYVISESLRLFPVVPLNNRTAVRDTILPVGGGADGSKPVPIRKGQTVGFIIYYMHRRPDIWGDDVNEFRPERFEDRKQDWSFLPFSGGPRVCLGQQYAITEASFLIIRMLQHFDAIAWAGSPGKPRKGLGITMYPRDGTQVRLRYAGKAG